MIEIKVLDDKFQSAIRDLIKQCDDLTIPFSLMIQSWYKSNNAIFALKGKGKYDDLSAKYKIAKLKRFGFVYPILKARGDLAQSLLQPGGQSIAKILNKKALLLGSSDPVTKYHQFGTAKMPARPPVLVGAEQTAPPELNKRRDAWVSLLENYVRDRSRSMIG